MAKSTKLRIRRSLLELQKDYENGTKAPLEKLMKAWKGIKELKPDDPRSFFRLGGYHGEPFRGAGWGFGNNSFWGGYCNHGNVLFPTWHRVYVLKVEEALQSIEGCEDVMLPYWDETDQESLKNGIPWALTRQDFVLDGVIIPNPLRSFIFPVTITDNISGDNPLYTKPKGYETVRYPLSGLVGTAAAKYATEEHNKLYDDAKALELLNSNVVAWLNQTVKLPPAGKTISIGVLRAYQMCLKAPNYTVFSNTTSAQEWNNVHDLTKESPDLVMPLEQPHNDIHLAVGGCDVPGFDQSPISGANGDMGENDTAALDPIFYFHHCNVDRVFWIWQKQNGYTDHLDIVRDYPGTNSSDSQGSTPGIAPNTWLDLNSPLNPFTKLENGKERVYTSLDCINIEKQLGFTYSPGSLEEPTIKSLLLSQREGTKVIRISGINRAPIKGSFVVSAFATIDGKQHLLGHKSVLSRWNVTYCANCQTHLEVKAFFKLDPSLEELIKEEMISVEVKGHGQSEPTTRAVAENKLYRIEIR